MKRTPYLISLGAIFFLSAYPLWMGAKVLAAHLREGYINAADYPKYVIPYTPIALALLAAAALAPLAIKYGKKLALLLTSVLGTGLFLLAETALERVMVFGQTIVDGTDVGSWQYALCAVTPEVMRTIEYQRTLGQELAARYSPAFKVHFYLIAILIVLAVLGVAHGFAKPGRRQTKPLVLQAISVAVFIALCVYACFTAFYRTGALTLSPLSSALMGLFFVAFGVTAGAYAGSLFYARRPALARLLPALLAMATAAAMYFGELVMMGGALFRYGSGVFFAPAGACPLAPADFAVIALSGALTYALLFLIRRKEAAIKPANA
jgi:hypothetical protein